MSGKPTNQESQWFGDGLFPVCPSLGGNYLLRRFARAGATWNAFIVDLGSSLAYLGAGPSIFVLYRL